MDTELENLIKSVRERWDQVPDCVIIGSNLLKDATSKMNAEGAIYNSKEILERTDNLEDRDLDLALKRKWSKEEKDNFSSLYPGRRIEFHVIPPLFDFNIQRDQLLFTLKASHIFWHPTKFGKTLYDLILLKRETGVNIHEDLFNRLYVFWTQKFGEAPRQNFDVSMNEFFDDSVQREMSHDELHLKVSSEPAYLSIVNEGSPEPIQSKFEALTEKEKLRVIVEEASVLALERFYPSKIRNFYIAYRKGIYLLIKRLAPLWMARWMINNIDLILRRENVTKTNN